MRVGKLSEMNELEKRTQDEILTQTINKIIEVVKGQSLINAKLAIKLAAEKISDTAIVS